MAGGEVTLYEGIPLLKDYQELMSSKYFQQIEKYSNEFLEQCEPLLAPYSKRWVRDPLHQWSRQWEYPYIINSVKKLKDKTKASVLDLGSGVTFLPYYLSEVVGIKQVQALDYDKTLSDLIKRVNKFRGAKIDFTHKDIRVLEKSKKESLDLIYCVSVLEHTDQYESIIKSCYELLKPGGRFCLTFDISLDGYDEIPLKDARKLLVAVERIFKTSGLTKCLDQNFTKVVTSQKISKINKKLMPWKYPFINIVRPALKLKGIGSAYKNLTFCCITVEKR